MELRGDLECVGLFARTLLTLLEEKQIVTQDQLLEARKKIDLLDGKLDEACWKSQPAMILTNASGTSSGEYPTEAWMAFDAEFLYVAVRCKHSAGKSAAAFSFCSTNEEISGGE